MSRPRVAFLGLGWIGRHRLQSVAESDRAEVVAIADADAEATERAAALVPAAKRVCSLDELLALAPDGVVIATPSAQHAAESLRALDAGAAVFCQKPLARSGAETATVVERARTRDRLLGVDLSYRHLRATHAVSELLRDGALGDLFACDLTFHNAYGPDKGWYYDRARAGGGCLMDLGIHLVDLLLLWTAPARARVVASALRAEGRRWTAAGTAVEDFAAVQLETTSGVAARIACSWKLPAGADAVIEATLFGTRAAARVRNVGGSFYDFTAERLDRGGAATIVSPPDDWGGRAVLHWIEQLSRDPGFDTASERLVDVAAVLDAAYEAACSEAGTVPAPVAPSAMS